MNGIRPDARAYRSHGVRITGVNLQTANYVSILKQTAGVMGRIEKKSDDAIAMVVNTHSKFE